MVTSVDWNLYKRRIDSDFFEWYGCIWRNQVGFRVDCYGRYIYMLNLARTGYSPLVGGYIKIGSELDWEVFVLFIATLWSHNYFRINISFLKSKKKSLIREMRFESRNKGLGYSNSSPIALCYMVCCFYYAVRTWDTTKNLEFYHCLAVALYSNILL